MFKQQIGILLLIFTIGFTLNAQDTLPSFTLVTKGNKRVVASWTNPYGITIRQLTIQRSIDSTKNFKSISTLPDPTVPQNGYVDTKADNNFLFYRLYILLDSGKYIFSKSKRPIPDVGIVKTTSIEKKIKNPYLQGEPETEPPPIQQTKTERTIYIKKRDSVIAQITEPAIKHFKDSLLTKTKDTLSFNSADTIVIKPFIPKEVFKASKYVFTEKDGSVKINLTDAANKKYTLKFFDENNALVFEIKQIKYDVLLLDKSNFIHAGWFKFELLEDGQLKEKHKLFIQKEF